MTNISCVRTRLARESKLISEAVGVEKVIIRRKVIDVHWFFEIHEFLRVVYTKAPPLWLPRHDVRYIVSLGQLEKLIQSVRKSRVVIRSLVTTCRCRCTCCCWCCSSSWRHCHMSRPCVVRRYNSKTFQRFSMKRRESSEMTSLVLVLRSVTRKILIFYSR